MAFIDDVMGFDPTNLDVFHEQVSQNSFDANIYKTNPVKLSKAEDGHYRAKIKIIYNPHNIKRSIVPQATYFIQDQEGSLLVRSKLANNDKTCPIFTSWKKLWFSGDETKKSWAKKMYDKTESQWVLVQVLEDVNQPELVGKILAWKLPKAIYNKMEARMNPSAESKKAPVPIMDYLIGLPLDLDVAPGPDDPKAPERRQREISYDLCDFDADYATIIKVDGTPLFTDEEIETIDNYVTAKNEVAKAKSEAKKAAALKTIESITPAVRELYSKALNYLKENAFDLEAECGYKEWDENTTRRVQNWINIVSQLQDPKTVVVNEVVSAPEKEMVTEASSSTDTDVDVFVSNDAKGDDLPF